MERTLAPEAAEDAARRVLDSRIGAVRELAKARAEVGHAQAALAAAEQADAIAYSAALRAGWTDAELRQVGLSAPDAAHRGASASSAPCHSGGDANRQPGHVSSGRQRRLASRGRRGG